MDLVWNQKTPMTNTIEQSWTARCPKSPNLWGTINYVEYPNNTTAYILLFEIGKYIYYCSPVRVQTLDDAKNYILIGMQEHIHPTSNPITVPYEIERIEWWANGYLHREDGPAIESEQSSHTEWWIHGKKQSIKNIKNNPQLYAAYQQHKQDQLVRNFNQAHTVLKTKFKNAVRIAIKQGMNKEQINNIHSIACDECLVEEVLTK